MIELRCSRDLALRLGAISPQNMAEHKLMRASGDLLVRDKVTSWPAFWPWSINVAEEIAARSS